MPFPKSYTQPQVRFRYIRTPLSRPAKGPDKSSASCATTSYHDCVGRNARASSLTSPEPRKAWSLALIFSVPTPTLFYLTSILMSMTRSEVSRTAILRRHEIRSKFDWGGVLHTRMEKVTDNMSRHVG